MSAAPLLNLSWTRWKANWQNVITTAAVAAGLEAGAFALFLYMFVQDGNRLLPVVGGSLLIFWFFHVGVSALHAYLISHPALSVVVAPSGHPASEASTPYDLETPANPASLKP